MEFNDFYRNTIEIDWKDNRYLKTCRNTNENASDNGLNHNVIVKKRLEFLRFQIWHHIAVEWNSMTSAVTAINGIDKNKSSEQHNNGSHKSRNTNKS